MDRGFGIGCVWGDGGGLRVQCSCSVHGTCGPTCLSNFVLVTYRRSDTSIDMVMMAAPSSLWGCTSVGPFFPGRQRM